MHLAAHPLPADILFPADETFSISISVFSVVPVLHHLHASTPQLTVFVFQLVVVHVLSHDTGILSPDCSISITCSSS